MSHRTAALVLALLAGGVYANAASNGFAFDDEHIIVQNERVHGAGRLIEAISSPYWPGSLPRIAMYRPLTTASFALEWELWGDRPTGYHITNVLLHVGATLLVFALLLFLAGQAPALVGAALFALHPVHVEAVSNLVGRAEMLAAIPALAACLVYLRSPALVAGSGTGRPRTWAVAGAVGALYFLALAAKEIAVTLPALLVLLDTVRSRDDPVLRSTLARWPAFVAAGFALLAYLGLRTAVLGTSLGNDPTGFLRDMPEHVRILTAISVWPEYLRLMLFPRDLVADYSPGVIMPVTSFGMPVVAGILTGGLLVLTALWAWRRQRLITVGIVWGVVVLLPVSNLFFAIGIILAERTLYLPSVGLAIAAAGVASTVRSARSATGRAVAAAAILVAALAGWRTWTRTPDWAGSQTTFRALQRDHPESFRVQWALADQLRRQGEHERALERFRVALSLMPAHYRLRFQYGGTLLEAGRTEEAAEQFAISRSLIPEYAESHVYRVAVLMALGRHEEAVTEGREAVRQIEGHRGVFHQLSLALGRTGRIEEALEARIHALDLAGDRAHWQQWLHRAELELRAGRPDQATGSVARARASAPPEAEVPTIETLDRAIRTENGSVLPYR